MWLGLHIPHPSWYLILRTFFPGSLLPCVCTRVVMSPLGAKLLQRALAENLSRYETAFGEIKIPGENSLADFLFRPPAPTERVR